jgi:hypothetical protein
MLDVVYSESEHRKKVEAIENRVKRLEFEEMRARKMS